MSEHFISNGLFGFSLIPFQKTLPSTVISIDSNMYRIDATLIFTITRIKVFYYTVTAIDYTALNFAIAGMRGGGVFFLVLFMVCFTYKIFSYGLNYYMPY